MNIHPSFRSTGFPTRAFTALAFATVATAHAADKPTPVTHAFIHKLVAEAASTHPKVAAAQARSAAAQAATHAVRLWADPELGLGTTAASQNYRRDNGDIALGISQTLPRRGLYVAQQRQVLAEQKMKNAEQRMTTNDLGLAVAQATLELALADETLALQTEELGWLTTLVKTATERSQSPGGSAVEPLRLDSEWVLRTQKHEAAQRQRAQLTASLNLLLGRNPKASWSALALPDMVRSQVGERAGSPHHVGGSPQLDALQHQADAAQAEADAARELRKPTFSIGLNTDTYSQRGVVDTMLTLKMTLPWLHRSAYDADIQRTAQLHAAAQSDLAAASREQVAQLNTLRTEAGNNEQLAAAYQSQVLPKMQASLEAIQGAWISSKATLLEVLEARRALLDARQEMKRAIAAEHVAQAGMEALTGGYSTSKGTQP